MYCAVPTFESDLPHARARRFLWATIVLGALLSLVACYLVATESLVIGSVRGGWRYPYGASFSPRIRSACLALCAGVGALLRLPPPATGRQQWATLFVWIAAATASHAAIRSLGSSTLEQIFVSPGANAFYSVAKDYRPSDVLGRFNRVREQAPLHAQSNMPGKTILVQALRHISDRTAVLPWLLVVISNLGAVLMFVFVRDLFEDARIGLFSAVLYLFIPARIFFFPIMNTITPLLILGCACLLLRWLRSARTLYAVLMGI